MRVRGNKFLEEYMKSVEEYIQQHRGMGITARERRQEEERIDRENRFHLQEKTIEQLAEQNELLQEQNKFLKQQISLLQQQLPSQKRHLLNIKNNADKSVSKEK